LLAVTSTKDHPQSAAFIDALNTFCGRPNVPIGAVRNGVTPELGKYLGLAEEKDVKGNLLHPHDLLDGGSAPEAVSLLRKTLAGAPDGAVKLVQVGFFTNLARLLESKPDESSPLDGVALIKQKVQQLVIMGGAFQTIRSNTRYGEYNVVKDLPSARLLAEKWPSPVVWSGFEIGIAVAYPWESVMRDYEHTKPHLIKEAYLAYVPQKPHDRPTWDLTAAFYAIYPDRGYFDVSPPGRVRVDEEGHTDFAATKDGKDRYLVMSELQAARVKEAFVQLCSEPVPRK
jgi:inosine-uridine nucleoside N-ribohydrolase